MSSKRSKERLFKSIAASASNPRRLYTNTHKPLILLASHSAQQEKQKNLSSPTKTRQLRQLRP
jgi:hypothetical protein